MAYRRTRRPKLTSKTSWTRTSNTKDSPRPLAALAAGASFLLLIAAGPRPAPLPSAAELLQRYAAATDFPGAVPIERLEISGRVSGSGLQGRFHLWRDGAHERHDSSLGPRTERVLFSGGRTTIDDGNGDVRELRGIGARRDRTQRFIDSGEFVAHPENVKVTEKTVLRGRDAFVLEVTAPQGEPETLVLDVASARPLREEYIEGDGPLTVDFDSYREIQGHLFPWQTTISDGEHAFDFVETTERVSIDGPLPDDVFAPFVPRYFELDAPVSIPIVEQGAHLVCDATVGTKTYRFLIDSGASGIVLDSRIVREQRMREEGSLEVR
ncbi:MAG: hypothetical protein JO359_12885, partial [Candidatus Eremiobacteraeota bacterium]|nr:hypothetical protein [Candidatus Eremiobacteraeota bacterium]